jgi:pyrimidine-nucleoside phosphorylase
MLLAAGVADRESEAEAKVRAALSSGRGLEKFREIVVAQGGDPAIVDDSARLPAAPQQFLMKAERTGYVGSIDAELVGHATMLLGAGRDRVEHKIDHAVGVLVRALRGDMVRSGEPVAEIHYREAPRLHAALDLLQRAWRIEDAPPAPQALVLETLV